MCGSTVHCTAFTRVNPLLVVYRFRPPAGRGHCGDRPRPERSPLIPLLENGLLAGWHAIGHYPEYQRLRLGGGAGPRGGSCPTPATTLNAASQPLAASTRRQPCRLQRAVEQRTMTTLASLSYGCSSGSSQQQYRLPLATQASRLISLLCWSSCLFPTFPPATACR